MRENAPASESVVGCLDVSHDCGTEEIFVAGPVLEHCRYRTVELFLGPEIDCVAVGDQPEKQNADGCRADGCDDKRNTRAKDENVAACKADQRKECRSTPRTEQSLQQKRRQKDEHEYPMPRLHSSVAPRENDERRRDKSELRGFANVAAVVPAAAVGMPVCRCKSADVDDSDQPRQCAQRSEGDADSENGVWILLKDRSRGFARVTAAAPDAEDQRNAHDVCDQLEFCQFVPIAGPGDEFEFVAGCAVDWQPGIKKQALRDAEHGRMKNVAPSHPVTKNRPQSEDGEEACQSIEQTLHLAQLQSLHVSPGFHGSLSAQAGSSFEHALIRRSPYLSHVNSWARSRALRDMR